MTALLNFFKEIGAVYDCVCSDYLIQSNSHRTRIFTLTEHRPGIVNNTPQLVQQSHKSARLKAIRATKTSSAKPREPGRKKLYNAST